VATTLDFVLLHLIILEPRDSSPQKAVEGLVKVKVVTSGSVYVARNITGVMLWMWVPEAGANHPVRQRRIPEKRRPLVFVCVCVCVCACVRSRACIGSWFGKTLAVVLERL
jgi:hypothetical protein